MASIRTPTGRIGEPSMAVTSHPFMGKVYVGTPQPKGSLAETYQATLLNGEVVEAEFKGMRDVMVFTDKRIIVFNAQGFSGKKIEVSSFAWRAVSAFSVENAGTLDIEAELKVCGSGWGVCEVQLGRGADVADIQRYLARKVLG